MMASDHTGTGNGDRFPSPEALAALRSALAAYLRDPGAEGEVSTALGRLAEEAQARKLKAEHMLMAFKNIWADLPETQAVSDGAERRRVREHLIKLCIDSYYRR